MITRKALIERKSLLIAEKNNLQSQIYGYDGAIQDCNYWLKQIEVKKQQDEGEVE
jgi:hypothetical protein